MCTDDCLSKLISAVDIVVDGWNGRGKFRSVCKIILRDVNGISIYIFIVKNEDINCEKDIYEVLKASIVKPLNDDRRSMTREDMNLYLREMKRIKCILKIKKK